MERRAAPKRPWYLLLAIVVAWLFGVGGCTDGMNVIGSYWSPMPDAAQIASHANDEDREAVGEAAVRCLTATESAKPIVFPLGVASFVLGIAVVMLAARALAGRSTARSLLVQLVLAQAAFVVVRDVATRELTAECLDLERSVVKMNFEGKNADASFVDRITPELHAQANLIGLVARCFAAGLVALALTRRGTREYYAAMDRRLEEGA